MARSRAHLETLLGRVSGKSALAAAIRYALSRWPALTRYLADGRLEIDNNPAERALRAIAIGRKNSHDRPSSARAIAMARRSLRQRTSTTDQ